MIPVTGLNYHEDITGIQPIKNSTEFKGILPHNLKLPIRGFSDPNKHCMIITNNFFRLFKNSPNLLRSLLNFPKLVIADAQKIAVKQVTSVFTDNNMLVSLAGWSNLLHNVLLPRLNYLFSTQFFGVQPVFGGIGFTTLLDNKVQEMTDDNTYHTILTPWEYIMFNHPVRAAADGEVVEIINEYEDRVNLKNNVDYNTRDVDRYLGNKILIKYNNYLLLSYAGIKKNSFTKRVGDIVKQGEIIARVGNSGFTRTPTLIFSIQVEKLVADRKYIPYIGNTRFTLPHNFFNVWSDHMEYTLVRDAMTTKETPVEFMKRLDSKKIDYRFAGNELGDFSFVKQLPNIQIE